MQLTRDSASAKYQITKFQPGCVTVNDQEYKTSILIMPDYLQEWSVLDINNLQQQDLINLLKLQPDVILLGSGNTLIFPQESLLECVLAQGIGIEVMHNAAACRTYTVLAAEQRRVLAALVI